MKHIAATQVGDFAIACIVLCNFMMTEVLDTTSLKKSAIELSIVRHQMCVPIYSPANIWETEYPEHLGAFLRIVFVLRVLLSFV